MPRHRYSALWKKLGIPADYATRRGLPVFREARRLVAIGRAADDGQLLQLAPRAAAAWHRLQVAAAADGLTLLPLSSFRSVARQQRIIRRKLASGQAIAAILKVNAAPGCSEHHTGRALDIGTASHLRLEESFAATPEFHWLEKHAGRFGFRMSFPRNNPYGFIYEPWHWCWHPPPRKTRAQKNSKSSLTLRRANIYARC